MSELVYPGGEDFNELVNALDGGKIPPGLREKFPSGNRGIVFCDPKTGRLMIGDESMFRAYNNEPVGCSPDQANPNYEEWFYDQNGGCPIESSDPLSIQEQQIVNQIMS